MVVSVVVSKRFLNDFKDLTDVINVMDELYYTTTTTLLHKSSMISMT
jgi:hypothetical protein